MAFIMDSTRDHLVTVISKVHTIWRERNPKRYDTQDSHNGTTHSLDRQTCQESPHFFVAPSERKIR